MEEGDVAGECGEGGAARQRHPRTGVTRHVAAIQALDASTNNTDWRPVGQRVSHMTAITRQHVATRTMTTRPTMVSGPTGVHMANIGTAPKEATTVAIIQRVKPRNLRWPSYPDNQRKWSGCTHHFRIQAMLSRLRVICCYCCQQLSAHGDRPIRHPQATLCYQRPDSWCMVDVEHFGSRHKSVTEPLVGGTPPRFRVLRRGPRRLQNR